ncbi:MAG TPA: sensor histidine kinase, partial [Actinomycetota bacterium]|nr:sensor histidine kinase [Actinomycetota bacterium]
MPSTTTDPRAIDTGGDRFRHDAMFYGGEADFLAKTVPFILEGVDRGEPVLVVVSADRIARLRGALDGRADHVRFADMAAVGQNPARILPAWRAFVSEQGTSSRPFRGIGEPIWAGRTRDELDECERHEALLNVAFDGAPAWWLMCPYDTTSLPAGVLEEAGRNHPFVVHGGVRRRSPSYQGSDVAARPFDRLLPSAPASAATFRFESRSEGLRRLRAVVADRARASGLDGPKVDDLVLAVSEIATNSV